MNMLPAQNLHPGSTYGGFACNIFTESFGLMSRFEGYNNHDCSATESCKGSDPLVASFVLEDESRTNSLNETGSSSKDVAQDRGDKGWLRLSVGGADTDDAHIRHNNNNNKKHDRQARGFGLTELDLLPSGASKLRLENETLAVQDLSPAGNFGRPLVLPQPAPEVNWTFRPISQNAGIATSSSHSHNNSSFIPFGPYFSRPFQLHTGLDLMAASAAGPSSDTITVVDPPRRPHSGIWCTLQPLQLNQGTQQALPQRSSSYLRIKDGRMTVRLLIKYLVKKLRLDSESEIEIRCRGEKLEGCLTMQHIRDNIWFSSKHSHSPLTLLPHSSTIDHIMVLHYATLSSSPSPS